MVIKANKILGLSDALNKLSNEKFPIVTAIKIAEAIDQLETPVKVISKKRTELIREYGKKDDKGELIVNDDGGINISNMSAFTNALGDMGESEIEIKIEPFLTIKELEDLNITFTPKGLLSLKPVIIYDTSK